MKRALAILPCLLWAHAASADMVSRTDGDVLSHATQAEVLRVDELGPKPMGTVLESLRGKTQVGARVPIPLGFFSVTLVKGDQLLSVCGADLCALGVLRDRAYRFEAGYGGDEEMVPGFVPKRALPDLMAGKDPRLCLHAHVHFEDDAKTVLELAGDFSGKDGTATRLTGIDGPLSATVFVGLGGRSRQADHTELSVLVGQSSVMLAGGELTADHECWQLDVKPSQPMARTPRVFQALLGGWAGTYVVARGTVEIKRGHGLPAGKQALAVTWDKYRMRWRSKLWHGDSPQETLGSATRIDLGFPLTADPKGLYLSIVTDGTESWRAAGPPVHLPIRLHKLGVDGEIVGTVTLAHVDDPTPPPGPAKPPTP